MKKFFKNVRGFTLVELMTVVAILGIIMAIAIPTYTNVTKKSNIKAFTANHELIVSSINMYASAHNGKLPPNANALEPYLLNDKGVTSDTDIVQAIYNNTPKSTTYVITFADSVTLTSTYPKMGDKGEDLVLIYTKNV